MSAPFYKLGAFGDEAGLIVAFLIGIGFGFFLERAGFGSARKLVSQFYLDDLAVFKVMFTAIVTAMLGVTYLSWAGSCSASASWSVATARERRSSRRPPASSTVSCSSSASPRGRSPSPCPSRS